LATLCAIFVVEETCLKATVTPFIAAAASSISAFPALRREIAISMLLRVMLLLQMYIAIGDIAWQRSQESRLVTMATRCAIFVVEGTCLKATVTLFIAAAASSISVFHALGRETTE